MRYRSLLACLMLLGCGDDDDGGAAGNSAAGTSGSGGRAGQSSSGEGGSTQSGGGTGGRTGSGAGAGNSGNTSGGGQGGNGSGNYGEIKLLPNVVAGQQLTAEANGTGSQQSALRVGSVTATSLYSLKYYITSIQLCEDLELQGSGFNNPQGCISLYNNMPAGSPDYNTYTVASAIAETTPGRYIDLMTTEGRAALRKPVTVQVPIAATTPTDDETGNDADGGVVDAPTRQTGVYRYGLINFYRPIKVVAQFPIIGEPGMFFRTASVNKINVDEGVMGGLGTERVEIDNAVDGDTNETVYMLNNGGALFVFQKPLAITKADIDAKTEIKIDLVFNPENFGQAYESPNCQTQPYIAVCDPVHGVVIDMPFVRMSPVPRKTGQKTYKETYLVSYEAHSKVRFELYYTDADAEAGIQGVDTAIVYDADAAMASGPSNNTIATNFVSQSGSVQSDDARVTFYDYRHMANMEGLVRRKSGKVKVNCLFTGSVCPTLGDSVMLDYEYVKNPDTDGDTLVSAD